MELSIELPIRVKKNKFKNNQYYYLNMNQYIKWHHNQRSNIKNNFKAIIYEKLPDNFTFKRPVEIEAQLYLKRLKKDGSKDKTKKDKGNVYAVVSKFFFDSLTDKGIIEDDNDEIIKKETILPSIQVNKIEDQKIIFRIKEI